MSLEVMNRVWRAYLYTSDKKRGEKTHNRKKKKHEPHLLERVFIRNVVHKHSTVTAEDAERHERVLKNP